MGGGGVISKITTCSPVFLKQFPQGSNSKVTCICDRGGLNRAGQSGSYQIPMPMHLVTMVLNKLHPLSYSFTLFFASVKI